MVAVTAHYDVIIIGGGLAGVSSAYSLAKGGQAVLLLEANAGVAMGASFANGGMVTPSMPDPWNGPGVSKHLFASLFDPASPMKLRPKAIPGLTRRGLAFLRNAAPVRHRRAVEANYALADCSTTLTREIAPDILPDAQVSEGGALKIFEDEAAFHVQLANARQLETQGLQYNVLSPQEVVDVGPVLAGAHTNIKHGIYYPADLFGDAHMFTTVLARKARGLGAVL